jgi:hypothetical protein
MNAGAMVAVHAAMAAQARSDVLDAFRVHGATAAVRAKSLVELGITEQASAIELLMHEGCVRSVDHHGRPMVPGDAPADAVRYFLDEAALLAVRDAGTKQKTSVVLSIGFALLLLAGGAVMLLRSTGAGQQ